MQCTSLHTGNVYDSLSVDYFHIAFKLCTLYTEQYILAMAQGKDHSFLKLDELANRLFHRYRKGSQENDGAQVSEFTLIWDKLSK